MTTRAANPAWLFAGLLAVSAVIGSTVGGLERQHPALIPPAAAAVGATAACLLACAALIPLWRRMDEVARAAHQSAWYWGGSAGSAVAGGLAVYATRETPAHLAALVPTMTVNGAFAAGVVACLLIQVAVYGVGWTVWWLSKR